MGYVEKSRTPAAGGQPMQLPQHLFRYVWAVSWAHQLPILLLTATAFLLEVVPLELQRRAVNDVAKHRPFAAVVVIGAVYVGTVLLQGATKLALNLYRSWVGERAKRDLRGRICEMVGDAAADRKLPDGTTVSMIVAEVEPIGGFIGSAVSEPLLQLGVLASIIAYIVHVDPWMGAAALGLLLPQIVFVPLMQRAMNRRAGVRVWLLRQIGAAAIACKERAHGCLPADAARIIRVFHLNMGISELKLTMNFLMNLLSHLQVVAALLLGGWWVLHHELAIGAIVAFISGVGRLNDPWGDLVNYFRDVTMTQVKFRLFEAALSRIGLEGRQAA